MRVLSPLSCLPWPGIFFKVRNPRGPLHACKNCQLTRDGMKMCTVLFPPSLPPDVCALEPHCMVRGGWDGPKLLFSYKPPGSVTAGYLINRLWALPTSRYILKCEVHLIPRYIRDNGGCWCLLVLRSPSCWYGRSHSGRHPCADRSAWGGALFNDLVPFELAM